MGGEEVGGGGLWVWGDMIKAARILVQTEDIGFGGRYLQGLDPFK